MAKKKVMKTVSVPTLKEVEVTACDICGKEVGDYRWWMAMETDDVCVGEFYLDIDVVRKEIWDNRDKYIGKIATVRQMKVGSKNGIPRLPTFVGLRDKDDIS